MAKTASIPDILDSRLDDDIVRLGPCFVSPGAAQLHIFGVLLGAHLGEVGFVPDADLATLPGGISEHLDELVDSRIWRRDGDGYRIDPDHALRTMRDSLDRLNDPRRCVATGSAHVRGGDGSCRRCGAPTV